MNEPSESSRAALDRAIALFPSQSAFARALGIKPASVVEWRKPRPGWPHGRVPAERCISIERITSQRVRRGELRPDLWGAAA